MKIPLRRKLYVSWLISIMLFVVIIALDQPYKDYNDEILISAEGYINSIKGRFQKAGTFLFFSLSGIVSIQARKVKSFPLFLSTILYNETKTSYRLFHYYPLDFCLLVILPLKLFTSRSMIKYE